MFGPGSARPPRVRHVARARAPRPDEGSVGFVARVLVRLVARRAGEARRARARAGRAVADAAAEARRSARRVRDDRHRRWGTNHQRFGREEGGETGAEDGVGGGGGGSGVLGGGAVFAAVGMEEPAVGVVRRGRDRARGTGGRIGRSRASESRVVEAPARSTRASPRSIDGGRGARSPRSRRRRHRRRGADRGGESREPASGSSRAPRRRGTPRA